MNEHDAEAMFAGDFSFPAGGGTEIDSPNEPKIVPGGCGQSEACKKGSESYACSSKKVSEIPYPNPIR